jgi:RsiW-degrading membrane proteinase PrsW (M82 family)
MPGLVGGLILAALPALPILAVLRRLDRARPEPLGLIGRSFLYGFIAVAPAAVVEVALAGFLPPLTGIGGHLLEAFIVAALVEEGIKFYFVRRYLWKRREFDEATDGMVYAISVSLGFAIVENFLYTWNDPGLLVLRSITAVPLHAIATGLMGYWLGVAKLASSSKARDATGLATDANFDLRALATAVAFHGVYDFVLIQGGFLAFLVFALLAAGGFLLRGRFAAAKRLDDLAAASGRPILDSSN